MQHYGQVVPFPPAWRAYQRHQLGQMPGVGMVAQAFMPTVQNWLGNVFGSNNRPAIEDIKAALELGQTISAESWGQAGLPPDGGQWYQDWLLQHQAQEAMWARQVGLDPTAVPLAASSPQASAATSALSNQVALLQAKIAAMTAQADYHAQYGDPAVADAYDQQIADMHRQMMQMQQMLTRTLALNRQQMQLQQFSQQQQQQQQPIIIDTPPADNPGGWPFDETTTMYIAAGLAGVGLLVLLSGRRD